MSTRPTCFRRVRLAFSRVSQAVLVALLVSAWAWLPCGSLAHAATYTVTKVADTKDGTCDADGSVREAVDAANASTGVADTITIPAGTYKLQIAYVHPGEPNNVSGDIDIKDEVTIVGAGAGSTILDADGIERMFSIQPGATVAISGVTITGGDVFFSVGGICDPVRLSVRG